MWLFSSAAVLVDLGSITIFIFIPDRLWSLRDCFDTHIMYIHFNLSLHILHGLHRFMFHSIVTVVIFFWNFWGFNLVILPYHRSRRDFLNFTSFLSDMSFMSMIVVHFFYIILRIQMFFLLSSFRIQWALTFIPSSYFWRHWGINRSKPTGYVMHQQFNIQQLYALPTLYLCVLYLSENKQRLVPLTA